MWYTILFTIYCKYLINFENISGLCVMSMIGHVWDMFGPCLDYVWAMAGPRLGDVSGLGLFGTCLGYVWGLLEECLMDLWGIFRACLGHVWRKFEDVGWMFGASKSSELRKKL